MEQFWIGQDFSTIEEIVIQPGVRQVLRCRIQDKQFPLGTEGLQVSARSKLAQSGLEIENHNVIETSDGVLVDLNYVLLGGRPLEIPQGYGVGRFFNAPLERMVWGPELVSELRSGNNINISGGLGETYDYVLTETDDVFTTDGEQPNIVGVGLRLRPDCFYIPQSDEPNKVASVKNYRQYLDKQVLVPVVEKVPEFWVTQTLGTVRLGPNHVGVLNMAAFTGDNVLLQTMSHLIDPGTDWPIRMELFHSGLGEPHVKQTTIQDLQNQRIIMHVYRMGD